MYFVAILNIASSDLSYFISCNCYRNIFIIVVNFIVFSLQNVGMLFIFFLVCHHIRFILMDFLWVFCMFGFPRFNDFLPFFNSGFLRLKVCIQYFTIRPYHISCHGVSQSVYQRANGKWSFVEMRALELFTWLLSDSFKTKCWPKNKLKKNKTILQTFPYTQNVIV